ncbi:probable disease resistance protein RF45 [Telopea speciosissima]|uniref:probable disease resistance protein RF45 n=1 Tax=Telopea speciosissima TaxID=54955 RepID=UPI001CC3F268|nr:probable disease resistance protein RF45 [Telopea speciosissima]
MSFTNEETAMPTPSPAFPHEKLQLIVTTLRLLWQNVSEHKNNPDSIARLDDATGDRFRLKTPSTTFYSKKINNFRKPLIMTHKLRKEINDIKRRIKNLSGFRVKYEIPPSEEGQISIQEMLLAGEVVGFQSQANELAKLLITEEDGGSGRFGSGGVVSITGMGGSGKTTLARKVYNRDDMLRYFARQAWVSLFKGCRVEYILYTIIQQVEPLTQKEKYELISMKAVNLGERLSNRFKEKNYLIVLDDKVVYQSPLIEASLNNNNNNNNNEKKNAMEALAKEMVAVCSGLPLAIESLGSLLYIKEPTYYQWNNVLEVVNWHLKDDWRCTEVSSRSYTELPRQLKSCFLYFGLFPKDTLIKRDRLIRLWITEGILESRENLTMEGVAEELLEELMVRNLVHVVKWKSNGVPESFVVHNLLLKLAISEATKANFFNISTSRVPLPPPWDCSRRAGFHGNNYCSDNQDKMAAASAASLFSKLQRSLLCFTEMFLRGISKFKLLKSVRFGACPRKIRFDLYNGNDGWIPEEFIVDQKATSALGVFQRPSSIPRRIDQLRHLQTLWFHTSSWIEGGLETLTNLRELGLTGIKGRMWDFIDALFRALFKLKNLELACVHLRKDMMETLEMLPKLKELRLDWHPYDGKVMKCSVGGFPKLECLILIYIDFLSIWIVEEGATPNLKILKIDRLWELECIPDGLRHIRKLQQLSLTMPKKFLGRIKKDGEDWEKIKHIPSINTREPDK